MLQIDTNCQLFWNSKIFNCCHSRSDYKGTGDDKFLQLWNSCCDTIWLVRIDTATQVHRIIIALQASRCMYACGTELDFYLMKGECLLRKMSHLINSVVTKFYIYIQKLFHSFLQNMIIRNVLRKNPVIHFLIGQTKLYMFEHL